MLAQMQNCPQRYFFNRGFYYLCRTVSRQGETGDDWKYDLRPVYGFYLLNFSLPESTHWRTDVIMANLAALTPRERAIYDENLKNYRDWRATLEYAAEEAEEKGMKRGLEEGMEKGKAEGLAEGQRLIAINLKKQGIDIEIIAQCTGLSVEEIDKL